MMRLQVAAGPNDGLPSKKRHPHVAEMKEMERNKVHEIDRWYDCHMDTIENVLGLPVFASAALIS